MNQNTNLAESLKYLADLAEKIRQGQTSRAEGKRYIIWGILTALGFIGTQVLIWVKVDSFLSFVGLWAVVVVAGFGFSATVRDKTETPKVFLSQVMGKIWIFLTFALWQFPVAVIVEGYFNRIPHLSMVIPVGEMAFLAIAAGIMGTLFQFKYFTRLAWIGFILMFVCALLPELFGIWFAIMQTLILTVPGIMILKSRGEK